MAKSGRKLKQIDWVQFDKLCAIQCTQAEIASWFDVSVDTIDRLVKRVHKMYFAEYYSQKKKKGLISLRRAQWQQACEAKSTAMLIWLGKQYLGQTDKIIDAENANVEIKLSYKPDENAK